MRKLIFLTLAMLWTVNAFATITVVKATRVSAIGSYVEVYKATFSTSQTLTTLDTVVIVNTNGDPFDISAMADTTISVWLHHKTGTDSSHIKIEMAATYLPTARTRTAYAGYEWRTMSTKSDSDAASYYHSFVTTDNDAGGSTQFVPWKVRFSVAEILLLNEYITAANPATIWISWRKQKPVAR